MRFFRFRLVNTLLFFLSGILIGFILKERLHPAMKPAAEPRYQADYAGGLAADAALADGAAWEDEPPAKEDAPARGDKPEREPAEAVRQRPARETGAAPADQADSDEISLEPDSGEPAAPVIKAAAVLQADPAQFFKKPAVYAGREIEMSLQMITAKRSADGWRLNFVYTGPGKKLEYLYVDDTDTLGERPDLRIGYSYRVRFTCRKGDTAEGNILSSVKFTGEKADWATGLSAIE